MAGPGHGSSSDRELVLSFQAGEPGAYEEMYRRHHHRVVRVCHRMLGNTQDAEEAAQETFLKAYQALPRFNGQFQLGAWLARIATNVCVDHLRVRSRSHLVALPHNEEMLEVESGPEDVVVGSHPRLDEAIRDIQPLHARALALRALEGLSHREIAGRLQMTPAQVKALLHRARSSLRKAWDQAQGWVAAPVLSIRSLYGRSENASHASQAGSNLVAISPQVPLIMEKVAASAVIVVAALSGIPSGSAGTDGLLASPSVGDRRSAATAVAMADGPQVDTETAPAEPKTSGEPTPLEQLAGTIESAVHPDDRAENDGKKNDDEVDDDDGVGDRVQPAIKSTTRRAKQLTTQLAEELGIGP